MAFLMRVGEVRQGGGKLADVCKCFANSLSSYNPLAKNKFKTDDEDDDVSKERETVASCWDSQAENNVRLKLFGDTSGSYSVT